MKRKFGILETAIAVLLLLMASLFVWGVVDPKIRTETAHETWSRYNK